MVVVGGALANWGLEQRWMKVGAGGFSAAENSGNTRACGGLCRKIRLQGPRREVARWWMRAAAAGSVMNVWRCF